eukprot:Partr_v1_DN28794_c2_g1_i4_m63007 putative Non-SMC condensin I complex subunit G
MENGIVTLTTASFKAIRPANKIKSLIMASSSSSYDSVALAFDRCQRSVGSARTNCNVLVKLLVKQQKDFFDSFVRCLRHLLAVKKSEPAVEKCIRLIALFTASCQNGTGNSEAGNDFTRRFLVYLLEAIKAKDRVARLRSCQILGMCVDSISEMDDDIFGKLQQALVERCRDKEAGIRMHAAVALSKFQGCVDDDEEDGVLEVIVYLLRSDPSSLVRKACLANIDVSPATVPFIVERIRDIDPAIRRHVFKRSLPEIGDFRVFSIADRERILSWGLQDRDPLVRNECAKMICNYWIPQCDDNIIDFLSCLDVVNGSVALLCLHTFFENNPSASFPMDALFWENLTSETAALAEAYYRFRNEDTPELSILALYLQLYLNKLKDAQVDEDREELSFVIKKILTISMHSDFSDEVGRRNLKDLLVFYLTSYQLDSNLGDTLDVLRITSYGEQDFAKNCTNVIRVLQSKVAPPCLTARLSILKIDGDTSITHHPDLESLKCLQLMTGLLQRCLTIPGASPFIGDFLELTVLPSLEDNDFYTQSAALACLIQYCIINHDLAVQNMSTLLAMFDQSHDEDLRSLICKAIFDASSVHLPEEADALKRLVVEFDNSAQLATIVEGFAKLYMFTDYRGSQALEEMLKLFFSTASGGNHLGIAQCLSFFFSAFCSAKESNMKFFASSFCNVFVSLSNNPECLTLFDIASQVISWTQSGNFCNGIDLSRETLKIIDGIASMNTPIAQRAALQLIESWTAQCNDREFECDIRTGLESLKYSCADRSIQAFIASILMDIESRSGLQVDGNIT